MKLNGLNELLAAVLELIIVLCVTVIAFEFGCAAAMAEQGYEAYGGEYLLLMIPAIYYPGKKTVQDWLANIRENRRNGNTVRKEE